MVFLNPYITGEVGKLVVTDSKGVGTSSELDYEVAGNQVSLNNNGDLILKTSSSDRLIIESTGEATYTSDFQISSNLTVGGDIAVSGNLQVLGTTTTINSETILVEDNELLLNGLVTGTPSVDATLGVNRGSSADAIVRWSEAGDSWQVGVDGGNLVSFTNGAITGSSIDVTGNSEANQFLINGSTVIDSSSVFTGTGGINTAGNIIGPFVQVDSIRLDSQNVYSTTSLDLGAASTNQWRIETNGDLNALNSNNISTAGGSINATGGQITASVVAADAFNGGFYTGTSSTLSSFSHANEFRINGTTVVDSSRNIVNVINANTSSLNTGFLQVDNLRIDGNQLYSAAGDLNLNGNVTTNFQLNGSTKWLMTTDAGGNNGSLLAQGGQYVSCAGYTTQNVNDSLNIGTIGTVANSSYIQFIDGFGAANRYIANIYYNNIDLIGQHSLTRISSRTGSYGSLESRNWIQVWVGDGVNIGNSYAGEFRNTGYVPPSDATLKENFTPLSGVTSLIEQLNPGTFNFIGDDNLCIGLLAQEVEAIIPEAVVSGTYLGIQTNQLVSVLIKGLQEAYARLDALENP